jgi:hypothetical protein
LVFGDKLNSGKVEFGLVGGPTFSNITNFDGNSKPGLNIGLFFNIKINDRFYLHPEAIPKSAMGAKNINLYSTGNIGLDTLMSGASVKRNIKAISLPLLVRYRIGGLVFIEGGPQIDLYTNSKDVFKTEVNGQELTYSNKVKDQITRFGAGFTAGLVYKLKTTTSLAFGARYYLGLTDILKPDVGTQSSRGWLINVYIPVGANKAQKKKQATPVPVP